MKITVNKKMSRPVEGKTSAGFNTAEVVLENEIESTKEKDIEVEIRRLSIICDTEVALALDSMSKTSVSTATSVKKTEHVETKTETKVETPVDTKTEVKTTVETKTEKTESPKSKKTVESTSEYQSIDSNGILLKGKHAGKNMNEVVKNNADWIDFMLNKCTSGQMHVDVKKWMDNHPVKESTDTVIESEPSVLKDADTMEPIIPVEDEPIKVDDINVTL